MNAKGLNQKSADRKRLSTSGLKAALNILEKWGCDNEQAQAILQIPRATYFKYRRDPSAASLNPDQLERVGYLLQIHAALGILFDNKENRYGFMKLKNNNPFFNGQTPLQVIEGGKFANLYETYKRIDSLRGGMW